LPPKNLVVNVAVTLGSRRVSNRVPVVKLAGCVSGSRASLRPLSATLLGHLVICMPRYLERKVAALGCSWWWLISPLGEGGRRLERSYPFARFEPRWMGLRLEPSHVLLARK
jgi:hypothetical protein